MSRIRPVVDDFPRHDLVMIILGHRQAAGLAQFAQSRRIAQQGFQRPGQTRGVVAPIHHAAARVFKDFPEPADIRLNDRRPGRHRLDGVQAKGLADARRN